MTLLQIYYAITIAEAGSMNKAAELLFTTQPTLTSAIKELERELGFAVFIRSGKGVELSSNGRDFIVYAKQVYQQYEILKEQFGNGEKRKQKFGISTQHYSFAIKAFTELVKNYDTREYEFSYRETNTKDVLNDVGILKSEIGILFISDFNSKVIEKKLRDYDLTFHPLVSSEACVFLSVNHPLADKKEITFAELEPYTCVAFEQGDGDSIFYAEEILAEKNYLRKIKVNDRGSVLNIIDALEAYTLCSGIVRDEVNGFKYKLVPFKAEEQQSVMQIGYVSKKNVKLSKIAEEYVKLLSFYAQ